MIVYLGADLMDNVADEELPASWAGRGAKEANLAASTFLASLLWLALDHVGDNALVEVFAAGLLEMSGGQLADIAPAKETTPAIALRVADAKSGAQCALYARAGAVLAKASPEVVDRLAEYARCVGTANQVLSDLGDITREGPSEDLRNGKPTLPVVHARAALRGKDGERLEELLRDARVSAAAHTEVADLLVRAGTPAYVALVAGVYRQRALRALAAAAPVEPAARELRELARQLASPRLDSPRYGGGDK